MESNFLQRVRKAAQNAKIRCNDLSNFYNGNENGCNPGKSLCNAPAIFCKRLSIFCKDPFSPKKDYFQPFGAFAISYLRCRKWGCR